MVGLINIVLVFIGGGIGASLRYFLNEFSKTAFGDKFPVGILFINIVGSFLIGLMAGFVRKQENFVGLNYEQLLAFGVVGILGGFTTFSSFSLNVIEMFQADRHIAAISYISLSVILSVFGAYLGLLIAAK